MKTKIEALFSSYIKENDLDIKLSYFMPAGYENAFGTFDITQKTLFINANLLENSPTYEVLFYFYHELRHAEQYFHPQQFDASVQKSIRYVILYNGNCFKLTGGMWKTCQLPGEEEYFTLAYQNLPYEVEANQYACETVKLLLPECKVEIEALYQSWLPQQAISPIELEEIFHQIDQTI